MTTAPQRPVARDVHSSSSSNGSGNPADRGNLYGIVAMQITILFFVTNDTLAKLLGSDVVTSQLIVVRGMFALAALFVMLVWSKHYKHWKQGLNSIVLLRGVLECLSAIFILLALTNLPLANVTAILLTIPLATTAAAAIFLGEQVGIRRWSAVCIGFIGVVAIVRPGLEGFNFYSLFALCTVIFASARDLIARRIPQGSSLWVVTFVTMAVSTFGGGLLGLTETWLPLDGSHYMLLAAAALFLTAGHYLIVIAMSNGEVSVVSSFRYISLPIALVYGFLLWGEVPDQLTWFGIALILGSGIYTIFRERKVHRMRQAARAEASNSASLPPSA